MKTRFSILSLLLFCMLVNAQTTLSNLEEMDWQSYSEEEVSPGFYGQVFEIGEAAKLASISVYIFDHWDHDETQSTVNFEVYSFDGKPAGQMISSDPLKITEENLDGWLTFELPTPMDLSPGKYLVAVGQKETQGFVAFGTSRAHIAYEDRFWMKAPVADHFDGSSWFTLEDFIKKTDPEAAGQDIDYAEIEKYVLMMNVTLAE